MGRPAKGITAEMRFHANYEVDRATGCWNWTGTTRKATKRNLGYGTLKIGNKAVMAHRFSFELFNGRPPRELALHNCDNPKCVNPNHLFEGTQRDNVEDCKAKGRRCRSEDYASAKLTNEIARQIRSEYRPWARKTASMYALAAKYGVSVSIISDVVHLKRWKEVA